MISLTFIRRFLKLATFVSKVSSARFLYPSLDFAFTGSFVWNQAETSLIEYSAFSATNELLISQPLTKNEKINYFFFYYRARNLKLT